MLIHKCTKVPSPKGLYSNSYHPMGTFLTLQIPTANQPFIHLEDFDFMITMVDPLIVFSFLNLLSIHNCVTTRNA